VPAALLQHASPARASTGPGLACHEIRKVGFTAPNNAILMWIKRSVALVWFVDLFVALVESSG
jgi:hypothetical protein